MPKLPKLPNPPEADYLFYENRNSRKVVISLV